MALSFKGGMHIHDHKKPMNKYEVRPIMTCDEHMFPIAQHIGAPLKVLVKEGDAVRVGDKIADAEEYMAVPVHSSVSGTVKKIEKHIHPNGSMVETVFVENDKLYTLSDKIKPVTDIESLSKRELLWVIRDAGIVGMGGAGFPAHVKLDPKDKIKYLIINGAECEPYITADHRRMIENTEEVVDGIRIMMKVLDVKEAYIGIETNKRKCIEVLKKHTRYDDSIKIIPLKPKYPQGAEKMLIKAITGKSVPSGGLPSDVGCVVMNIETAYAINRAFREGMPLVKRIVTVSGDAVNEPSNLLVPLGVPFSFLFEAAGGFKKDAKKVIMGGPMMGMAQFDMSAPVIKTTSSLIAFSEPDKIYDPDTPCIRCGKCVEHCPMGLMPNKLSTLSKNKDTEGAVKYNILDCMQCGMCSYICPAKKNLLANIRTMRPDAMRYLKEKKEAEKNG